MVIRLIEWLGHDRFDSHPYILLIDLQLLGTMQAAVLQSP